MPLHALQCSRCLCKQCANCCKAYTWLYQLMLLDNLSALSLTNCEGCTFTFQEGVLPVLSVCGARLHSLILSNFPGVDIAGESTMFPQFSALTLSSLKRNKEKKEEKEDEKKAEQKEFNSIQIIYIHNKIQICLCVGLSSYI